MPQEFCTVRSIPKPFSMPLAGSTTTEFSLRAPTKIVWDDGTVDAWVPEGFAVTSMYDGTAAIDTFNFVWLIVAVKGAVNSARLVKEVDYANIDTVLGAGNKWAAIYRILGTDYEEFQQAGSGGATPLPPEVDGALFYGDPTTHQWVALSPAKGDLVRGNLVNSKLIWERYPITAGTQGDVLTNDRGNSGLPIWLPPPIGTGGSAGTSATTKCLNLWNGSSNNPPPTGWLLPTFDDNAWPAPVLANTGNAPQHIPPSSHAVWPTVTAQSDTQGALFRVRFTMGATPPALATLNYTVADSGTADIIQEIRLNGFALSVTQIVANQIAYNSSVIDLSDFVLGGLNVLTMWVNNNVGPGTWIAYALALS